jgi:transposase
MSGFDLRQAQGLMVVAQGGSIREVAELICASVIGVFACARRFA